MDLTCHHQWARAYFHTLHDCIMPHICHIEQLRRTNGSACFQTHLEKWIKLLSPNVQRRHHCWRTSKWVDCGVDDSLKRLLPYRDKTPTDIVLLHRNNTRVFEPHSLARLRDALSEKGRVVIFTGKESPLQTVRIFQRARWLIGYHGAGLSSTAVRCAANASRWHSHRGTAP